MLLGLPPHHLDHESAVDRQARLAVVASAISDSAKRAVCAEEYRTEQCRPIWPGAELDLAALLVVQAYSESRLAKNVHEGRCRQYECDPVRVRTTGEVRHRARSLWQIHDIAPVHEEWDVMVGADFESTRVAAWAAAKILSRGYRACGHIEGSITQYAGVNGCRWSEAARRGKLVSSLAARARLRERADAGSDGPKASR